MKKISNRWRPEEYTGNWKDAVGVILHMMRPLNLPLLNLTKDAKILECGVGSGKWSAAFALLGFNVTAMDNSNDMLSQVRTNFPNIKIQICCHDVRDYPLVEDNSIGLLFSEGLIEHFLDDNERKKVLTNFYKAVKGGAVLIVPYRSKEVDEIYYTFDSFKEEVADAGFHILHNFRLMFLSGDGKTHRKLIGVTASKK